MVTHRTGNGLNRRAQIKFGKEYRGFEKTPSLSERSDINKLISRKRDDARCAKRDLKDDCYNYGLEEVRRERIVDEGRSM